MLNETRLKKNTRDDIQPFFQTKQDVDTVSKERSGRLQLSTSNAKEDRGAERMGHKTLMEQFNRNTLPTFKRPSRATGVGKPQGKHLHVKQKPAGGVVLPH